MTETVATIVSQIPQSSCFGGAMAFWWTIVNIMLPLLPLALAWGLQALRGKVFEFRKTIKDGQLCFYPVAILGVAGFDYVPNMVSAIKSDTWSNNQTVAIASIVFLLLGSALAYAVFQYDHVSGKNEISDVKTRNISLLLTFFAILITYNTHVC